MIGKNSKRITLSFDLMTHLFFCFYIDSMIYLRNTKSLNNCQLKQLVLQSFELDHKYHVTIILISYEPNQFL